MRAQGRDPRAEGYHSLFTELLSEGERSAHASVARRLAFLGAALELVEATRLCCVRHLGRCGGGAWACVEDMDGVARGGGELEGGRGGEGAPSRPRAHMRAEARTKELQAGCGISYLAEVGPPICPFARVLRGLWRGACEHRGARACAVRGSAGWRWAPWGLELYS
jgi:hypothetical protein